MPNPENRTFNSEKIRNSVVLALCAAALAGCVQGRPYQREGEYEVLPSIKPTETLVIPPVTPQGDNKVFVPRLSNEEQPAVPTATATPEQTAATATPEQPTATIQPTATATPEQTAATIQPTATLEQPKATATPEQPTATIQPTATATPEQTAATIQPTATLEQPKATATPEQPTSTPAPIQTIVPTQEVIKDYELNNEAGFTDSMNRIMGNSWQSLLPEGWRYGDPISMELFESLEVNKPIRNWEAYHTPDHIKYIKNHSVERFLPYGELEVNFYHGMDSIVSNWKGNFLPPNWKYGDRVSKDLYVFLSLNQPAWEGRFSPSNVQYINNYDPNLTGYGGQLPSDGGNGFPILPTPETGPVQPGQPVELPGMPIEDYLDQILPDWRNHIPTDWQIGDPLPQELVSYLDQNIPNWRDSVPPGYLTPPEILPIPTPGGNP